MKFIDWFAGVGGFRRGMELAGHECVGFCEYDKYAIASYTSMHLTTSEQTYFLSTLPLRKRQEEILKEEYRNGEWFARDIRTVDAGDVPRADIYCFGAPCQDFSIAGLRRGMEGERSVLVREVFRIVKSLPEGLRPTWLIYENVKGMLSSNRGKDFLAILSEMDELGYDAEWQVLNTKHFGLPQNRERVYTVGHFRGRGGQEIFPVEGTDGKNSVGIIRIAHANNFRRYNQTYDPSGIVEAMDTGSGGGHNPYVAIPVLTPDRIVKHQNGRRFKDNGDDMYTLTSQDVHGVAINIVGLMNGTRREYGFGEDRNRVLSADGLVPTITSTMFKDPLRVMEYCPSTRSENSPDTIYYPKEDCYVSIRKLTPKECFRLQGWTDEYFERAEFVNFDSQLYKQAGNGVSVNVVYEIGRKIHE